MTPSRPGLKAVSSAMSRLRRSSGRQVVRLAPACILPCRPPPRAAGCRGAPRPAPPCAGTTPAPAWPRATSPPPGTSSSPAGSPRPRGLRRAQRRRARDGDRRRRARAPAPCCSRAYDERGLVFFTNLTSRKGRELAANPTPRLVCPGTSCSARSSSTGRVGAGTRAGVRRPTSPRGPAARSSGRGRRTSRAVLAGREALERAARRGRGALRGRGGARAATSGAGCASSRTRWSSGRAGRRRLHDRLRYRRDAGGWRGRAAGAVTSPPGSVASPRHSPRCARRAAVPQPADRRRRLGRSAPRSPRSPCRCRSTR